MKTKHLLVAVLFFFSMFISAIEIHVPTDYATIQQAINAASNGDIIIVENGTYVENIDFLGKEITLASNFYLSNDINDIYNTVIDGSGGDGTDLGSCVSFKNSENNNAVLQGFTIKNGSGTKTGNEGTYFRTGGGIIIDYASPTIINNIITNNECVTTGDVSGAGGAGIRVGYGVPIITNNIIKNNTGGYAGGIMISRCGSATVFKNNLVVNNTATGEFNGGGGIYIDWYPINLENNTIAYNHSGDQGGGIISTGTTTIITNCIVYGNTATNSSPQIMKRYGGNANITFSCIEGGFDGVGDEEGVITDNPLFFETDLYHLSNSSPCIDAGNSDVAYNDIEDTENPGNARYPSLGNLRNDMGAYGGQGVSLILLEIEKIKNNSIDIIYKNPYDNEGIDILSKKNMELSVDIYNYLGKKINKSIKVHLNPGINHIDFNINDSCLLVIKSKKGEMKSIKLLKKN